MIAVHKSGDAIVFSDKMRILFAENFPWTTAPSANLKNSCRASRRKNKTGALSARVGAVQSYFAG